MKEKFEEIFRTANTDKTTVTVKQIGDRPCAGDIDATALANMADTCREIIKEVTGVIAKDKPASTDCNIPLSLGIPAVCIPTYNGSGAHTREESLEEASLLPGLEITIKTIATLSEVTV